MAGQGEASTLLNNTPAKMIEVRGARVHNLKSVNVDIPRGMLVAICGVSGSGKTSLALDTLYAEGQRRYIESFSAYTRQFLERLDKPDYDRIDGLPPALAVARAAAPRGNRSTVGTASETLDYLRLLYAKLAELWCYNCGQKVNAHSPQSVGRFIETLEKSTKLMVAFETHWEDVGERASVLTELQTSGFVRIVAGKDAPTQALLNLGQDERGRLAELLPAQGRVLVIVDRLRGGDATTRSAESLEIAFERGLGEVTLLFDQMPVSNRTDEADPIVTYAEAKTGSRQIDEQTWYSRTFTRQLHCTHCDITFPAAVPGLFSFNSPLGACEKCEGFGDTIDLDMDLVVPDKRRTLREGAIAPWSTPAYSHNLDALIDMADGLGLPLDVPFSKLSKKQIALIRDGDPKLGFEGLAGFFHWLERKKYKMHVRVFLSRWRSYNQCDQCHGARLNPLALSYRLAGARAANSASLQISGTELPSNAKNIAELCELQVNQLVTELNELIFSERAEKIAKVPFAQVMSRLGYLQSVGLGYLSLSRTLRTLSGGEAQRTALTAALGSSLVNMLYVLDEPSVGLHPHDVQQLAGAIENLSARGNTVVMIEHEEALLDRADWLIEVGPAAGSAGGQIVYSGPRSEVGSSASLTGDYLSGNRTVPVPSKRRTPSGSLKLTQCTGHNLKGIDVEFPLGVLCLVTGVSGSGKSTLVQDTLYGALNNRLSSSHTKTLTYESILGIGQLDDCVLVDQTPVSRSPRSNPVTYVKAFDEIRGVFADTIDARTHNYTAGHFSFNSELGRCPRCEGDGVLQIDMQFLADIFMTCPDCGGSRYRKDILRVRYRDRDIAEVLALTVREAQSFFRGSAKVQQKLKVLSDVGLQYLQLGQAATTLSAGEAQRLKLAAFLASASKKRTLFILDEPTTGLHSHDIVQLLDCFDALLDAGNSLIVVEHNVHLMAAADHIIDLGPGPAELGGYVVASGSPQEIADHPNSVTGRYLAEKLSNASDSPANS